MAEDVSILTDIFNVYYDKAKKAHETGNVEIAKRNYLLASETLLKIAKSTTTPQLRKAQYDRALRLAEIAENLPTIIRQQRKIYKPASFPVNAKDSINSKVETDDEDGGKQWQSSEIPDIKFADVAGLENVKRTITTRIINPVKYPEKYAKYGKKSGGGVLLYGPPGTGKTMIAKAIAGEVGASFYAVKGSDIMSKYVGDSEKNISSLFEAAKSQERAIIFIDEMDTLFGERGKDIHNDKRVNEFLQQIDGFASKAENLLLLGATNRPWDIDSAAVRSGRFSEKIYVPLPDDKAREFLLKKGFKNCPIDNDVDWAKLVKFTKGYSGADIAEICDRAKEEPLNKYITTDTLTNVKMLNILEAIKAVSPTVTETCVKEFERYIGKPVEQIYDNLPPIEDVKPNIIEPIEPIDDEKNTTDVIVVAFADRDISLDFSAKPKLEFTLSKDFEKVYICIDSKHYVCTKKLNTWVSEELDIEEPGEYEVVISSDYEIAKETIRFNKGIIEEDLGL